MVDDNPANSQKEEEIVKKIKFRIESWEKGREFMDEVSNKFNLEHVEIDGDLRITSELIRLSCHFDTRGFSYILLKLFDETLESNLNKIVTKYKL
jgi:hypothetical protein